MTAINDAWFHRIKAAQRDLIRLAGGIERAAEITSFGKSSVGRWNNGADPELMPPAAVYALEADCGVPVFTAAMAGLHGRRLSDPDGDGGASSDVMARYAETARQASELLAEGALAMADGRWTPAEAASCDRAARALEAALGEFRGALAGVRASGGFSVVEGGK